MISFENLTPEERSASKRKEAAKITIAKIEKDARDEERAKAELKEQNMILEMHEDGMNIAKIAKFTQKTEEEIQQIIAKHKG